jgi:hypothetical protein
MIGRRSVSLAALVLATAGLGLFSSSASATNALSDSIHFKGAAFQFGLPLDTTWTFNETSCAVSSRDEQKLVYGCSETGTFKFAPDGTASGAAKLVSADSPYTTTWTFTLTPTRTSGTYQMSGSGTEFVTHLVGTPCVVTGKMTIAPNQFGLGMTSNENVYDS